MPAVPDADRLCQQFLTPIQPGQCAPVTTRRTRCYWPAPRGALISPLRADRTANLPRTAGGRQHTQHIGSSSTIIRTFCTGFGLSRPARWQSSAQPFSGGRTDMSASATVRTTLMNSLANHWPSPKNMPQTGASELQANLRNSQRGTRYPARRCTCIVQIPQTAKVARRVSAENDCCPSPAHTSNVVERADEPVHR